MIKRQEISGDRLLSYIAIAVTVFGGLHYLVLHWTLITDPMPLTMREAAPIRISEAYAEKLSDGFALPYAIEQYPESISVYGPVYTMLTGTLQVILEVNPYFLQRCFVGLAILGSALVCGLSVMQMSNYSSGLLATVWFYMIQVASLTVVSGPSALAVLFYVLGIAAILRFGTGRIGLLLAVTAGFLGLLTKPYVVLLIPAVLIYTYLFHSPRRALIAAAGTALSSGILLYLMSLWMPAYFHSVFQIHSAYATRDFGHLLSQTFLFTKLNFGLLVAFCLGLPLSGYLIPNRKLKCLWGTRPWISPDIGFDRLLVLVAGAALFLSLGWHGGAFLIYFNHLLLPPLLIAAFRSKDTCGMRYCLTRLALIINVILLIFWRPPLRAENSAHLEVMSLLVGKSVLVDPIFEPYTRLFRKVELIDHGQAEYLVYYDQYHEGRFSGLSAEWEKQLASKIESGKYAAVFLAPHYNRKALLHEGIASDSLAALYETTHVVQIPIYFLHFKDWSMYGNGHADVYLFQKKDIIKNDLQVK